MLEEEKKDWLNIDFSQKKNLWKVNETNEDTLEKVSDILYWKEISNLKRISIDLPKELLDMASQSGVSIDELLKWWVEEFLRGKKKQSEIDAILWNLSVELLEDEVINFMDTHPSYFAKWSEAEVFKMHIPWKEEDILVVKRKYIGTSNNEFDLHSVAKDIEIWLNQKTDNFVRIPSLFHHFNKDWEEYILMEYIKWKTLYLEIIEAILSQETIKLGEKIKEESLKKEFYHIYYSLLKRGDDEEVKYSSFNNLNLEDSLLEISDDNWELRKIDLGSDEAGENAFDILYWILKQARVKISWDPDEVLELWRLKTKKLIYDMVNNSNFKGIWIFSEEEALKMWKWINRFLNNMHDNWFYHRDLWNNTRNIILTKDKKGYIPTIIDFWKSKHYKQWIWDENPYLEESVTWDIRPANDGLVVTNYISKLVKNDTNESYKLVNREKNNSLDKLYVIWDKLNIKKEDIDLSYNIIYSYKNFVYFDLLTDILESRKKIWWYELNMKKSSNKELMREIEGDKSKILADVIVLMYFAKESNFQIIDKFIDSLELTRHFNPTNKKKYIELYKEVLSLVSIIRK